jgi:hypothetical protein
MSLYSLTLNPKTSSKPSNNTSYENFKTQLIVGQAYEQIAQEKIKALYPEVEQIISNNTNAYDFLTLPTNITYEVKADLLAIKTGYFFIEFYGYGKESGIKITKALYHIITDGKYYFLISTAKLKDLVMNCNIKKTKDGSTMGFMLSRFDLVKNSICI